MQKEAKTQMVQIWEMWMVLAVIFIVGEIFTAGFFLFWFGIGAAIAGVLAVLGFNQAVQWAAFAIVSAVLFMGSRRFAERFTRDEPPGIGANRFIGKRGVTLEDIDNLRNTGRVRIDKEEWRADSATETTIPKGTHVRVVGLDGTHLLVEKIEEVE